MPAAVVNQHAAGPSEEEIAAAKALAAKAEQFKKVGACAVALTVVVRLLLFWLTRNLARHQAFYDRRADQTPTVSLTVIRTPILRANYFFFLAYETKIERHR